MGCFDKIGFVDDNAKTTPNGIDVLGAFADIEDFVCEYSNIIVAIGRPDVRLNLIHRIEETTPCRLLTIIFPSFRVMTGRIVEPMDVVNTGCVIAVGCILSAGMKVCSGMVFKQDDANAYDLFSTQKMQQTSEYYE